MFVVIFFFFSSRRRHTRCWRDWSSDVCSSDLITILMIIESVINAVKATNVIIDQKCKKVLKCNKIDYRLNLW